MRISLAGRVAGLLAVLLSLTPAVSANPHYASIQTGTPIKYLVVIFPENISFDHYFGTYLNATNPPGEPRFVACDDIKAGSLLNLVDIDREECAPKLFLNPETGEVQDTEED